MKSRFYNVLLFILLSVCSVGYADSKPLIVGSEQNYPPFALGLTDETADGFTVELWREVAKEMQIDHHIRVLPFHEVLQGFKTGKIDVLINLAQSDERRQFADFTVPHVIVNGAIFVRKGNNTIKSEADLKDKQIIVLNADLAHDYAMSKGWKSQLILVDTSELGFQLLASGQYDAVLLSKLTGQQTLKKMQLTSITALPIKVGFAQKFSFAVHKGNAELLAKINEGLALVKTNGIYDKLYEKWFGIYEEESLLPIILKYLLPVVGFFLILIAILFYRRHIERQQALLALQASESRFRDLFENAPLPYQALDKNGYLLYVNEAWLELVGCSQKQAIGQFFADFVDIQTTDELNKMLIAFKQNQHKGKVLLTINSLQHSHKERMVSVKWQIAYNKQGAFQRAHCILNDITERCQAEQALKVHQAELALAHTDLLKFTYIAAHHLQEPTRRVVTFVQHLQTQLKPVLTEETKTTLYFIEQSALRQRALVHDIQRYLAVIKPTDKAEKVSVEQIIVKVLKHHANVIKETQAVIHYADLPIINIEPSSLYEIFNSLIDNALRYRRMNQIPQITIKSEIKKGRVYYQVIDNGIGIPNDYRERVFDVFERLQTNENSDSTGIGLAIVKRIVQSHHGQISLTESENGGTTVLFDLPE